MFYEMNTWNVVTWYVQNDKIVLKNGPNTLTITDFCEVTKEIISAAKEIQGHDVLINH